MSEQDESAEGHSLSGLRDAITSIREDREHGASWLARLAAQSLVDVTGELLSAGGTHPIQRLKPAVRALATVRPSMAALANTVALIWAAATTAPEGDELEAGERLRRSALDAVARWDSSAALIERTARPFLHGKLYTHSRSGTVERVLTDMARQGKSSESSESREIVVAESRPGGEGVPGARALAEAGWRVTLIPDDASGIFLNG